jgi:hypothetical protein
VACEADEDCKEVRRKDKLSLRAAWSEALSKHGVKLKGDGWGDDYIIAVGLGVTAVANKLGDAVFKKIYGGLTFTWGSCNECNGAGGYTYRSNDIRFASMAASSSHPADYLLRATNNVIHELGHAFNVAFGKNPEGLLANDMAFNELLIRSSDSNSYSGFASPNNERVWVQNPSTTTSEVFADQFLGWVSNTWETDLSDNYGKWTPAGAARAAWMDQNLAGFLLAYH